MSRDIRSFFVVKNPKSSQQNEDHLTKETKSKLGKKKRPIVIDSDSDEESSLVSTKRCKSSVDVKKQISHKKPNITETKSKYFESHNVSVTDIFDNTPVRRDTSRKIIKKIVTKEDKEKESHLDQDFEAELAKLDDTWSDISAIYPLKSEGREQNKVERGNDIKSFKESQKKSDAVKSEHNRQSPRKKKSDVNYNESPKRFKAENKSNFLKKNDNELPTVKGHIKHSPVKSSIEQSLKTSLNTSKSKTPEKYVNEESSKQGEIKFNGGSSHKKNSRDSKTEIASDKTPPISPIKRIPSNTSSNVNNNIYEKKKDLSSNELSGCTKQEKNPGKSKTIGTTENKDTTQSAPSNLNNLWVEKYKPTTTKQIIGQQGEKSCVNKLIAWLKNWDKNQGNKKLAKPNKWIKNDDGAFFKAALLSGPPGVGKTTTAHLVCKELGLDIVEFNASDTRSKRLLHEEVSELLSSKSLSPFFTGKGDQVTKKHVLLMDEVDGMAGNEDRGGVQELISLIKQSRIPVICMCNDRNHPKIRSLSNFCFDLRFSKPRVEQIRGAMMSVCFKEKLKLKPDELAEIITSANQDIRLIMNHLSILAMEKSNLAHSTKHIKLGPWDIVKRIFSEEDHKSMSIHDKCDLFFHDYSITPLFVQENYLNAVPHKPEAKNKIKKMELFAEAARSLSFGDLTEKSIRSKNAWGLLPVQAVFSSLVPGEVLEGHLGAQINFPAWFGKNSRQTKMSRLVQELTVHSRLRISGNREAMNLDYLTSLGNAITSPLLHDGVDGVTTALSVLSEYCLVREDMESIAELSTWPGCKNQFAQVESKVKAAFTRAYNKTSAPTPYAAVPVKKGRGDVDASEGMGEEDEAVSQDVEDEEEEGLEADAMIMVKKKPANKKIDKDVQPASSKGTKNSKRGRKK